VHRGFRRVHQHADAEVSGLAWDAPDDSIKLEGLQGTRLADIQSQGTELRNSSLHEVEKCRHEGVLLRVLSYLLA
jgi:hypothetical protein